MSSSKNLEFKKTSFLNKSNSAFIEQMYLRFINRDPELPDSWKNYFEEMGEELDIIIKEIKGPSWGINKQKIDTNQIKKINAEFENIVGSPRIEDLDAFEWWNPADWRFFGGNHDQEQIDKLKQEQGSS